MTTTTIQVATYLNGEWQRPIAAVIEDDGRFLFSDGVNDPAVYTTRADALARFEAFLEGRDVLGRIGDDL